MQMIRACENSRCSGQLSHTRLIALSILLAYVVVPEPLYFSACDSVWVASCLTSSPAVLPPERLLPCFEKSYVSRRCCEKAVTMA